MQNEEFDINNLVKKANDIFSSYKSVEKKFM